MVFLSFAIVDELGECSLRIYILYSLQARSATRGNKFGVAQSICDVIEYNYRVGRCSEVHLHRVRAMRSFTPTVTTALGIWQILTTTILSLLDTTSNRVMSFSFCKNGTCIRRRVN